jgi:hypothetical protein
MFSFRCPACGKQHLESRTFDKQFQTPCLRCGDIITVNRELIHAGADAPRQPQRAAGLALATSNTGTAAEGIRPDLPLPIAAGLDNQSDEDNEDLDGIGHTPAATGSSESARQARRGRRSTQASAGGAIQDDSAGTDGEEGEETLEMPAPEEDGQGNAVSEEPWQPSYPIEAVTPWWKRWQVLTGIGAAVLLAAGTTFYFMKSGKSTPTKVVASKKEGSKSTLTAAADDASPPGDQESMAKAPENKPVVRASPVAELRISACRLAAELAAKPDATNDRYAGKIVEVVGRFNKLDAQVATSPVSGMHALFAVDGPPVGCALADTLIDKKRWNLLREGEGLAVRGLYVKSGILQQAELVPVMPPADDRYKGKEIELSGIVDAVLSQEDDRSFPCIKLEAGTNCPLEIHCLFRKTEDKELRKLRPGTAVVVKATCGGRWGDGDKPYVRLDNSEFVYTSAAVGRQRLEAALLAREYEEDLRSFLLPPFGGEERLNAPIAMADLNKEALLGRQAIEKKYLHKIVTVVGKAQAKVPPRTLFLESGRTDQPLRVQCMFSRHEFAELDDAPEFHVRGFVTGFTDNRTLRLDNCETLDSTGGSDRRRTTADFLPHTPGAAFTFDVATAATSDKKENTVMRVLAEQRDAGVTETFTSHVGSLSRGWLLSNRDSAQWVLQPKTRKVRSPGPVFYRRLSAGFVEVGQVTLTGPGKSEIVWQPALKIGARAGAAGTGRTPTSIINTWWRSSMNSRGAPRWLSWKAGPGLLIPIIPTWCATCMFRGGEKSSGRSGCK